MLSCSCRYRSTGVAAGILIEKALAWTITTYRVSLPLLAPDNAIIRPTIQENTMKTVSFANNQSAYAFARRALVLGS